MQYTQKINIKAPKICIKTVTWVNFFFCFFFAFFAVTLLSLGFVTVASVVFNISLCCSCVCVCVCVSFCILILSLLVGFLLFGVSLLLSVRYLFLFFFYFFAGITSLSRFLLVYVACAIVISATFPLSLLLVDLPSFCYSLYFIFSVFCVCL